MRRKNQVKNYHKKKRLALRLSRKRQPLLTTQSSSGVKICITSAVVIGLL
jgi:hypothetical protein